MTKIGILLLRCFVFTTSVSYIQCKGQIQNLRENGLKTSDEELSIAKEKRASDSENVKLPSGGTIEEYLHPKGEFLAGEDTPVWIAHRVENNPVIYRKQPKGIVKQAIDYWKTIKSKGLNFRTRRNSDDINHSAYHNKDFRSYRNIKETSESFINFATSKSSDGSSKRFRDKRYLNAPVRLSILVTTDFKETWPNSLEGQQRFIKEKILYVLAFWNGVDLQFRHIKKPLIFLRITGIIIGQNKAATPYVHLAPNSERIDIENQGKDMRKYWLKLSAADSNFSRKSFDIVATLTDTEIIRTSVSIQGYSTYGPPCHYKRLPIFISLISDNGGFSGLQNAVHETAHGLGAPYTNYLHTCPNVENTVMAADYNSLGRKWTECTLTSIEQSIWGCGDEITSAKVYHPPGKPVETILPGLLFRANAQCQSYGWEDGYVCWEKLSCSKLVCANDNILSRCAESHPPLDGTTCGVNDLICLDQTCVPKPEYLMDD